MNKEEIERLKQLVNLRMLEKVYEESLMVCDPIAFIQRQKFLLQAIAKFLLEPLYEHRKKKKEEEMSE